MNAAARTTRRTARAAALRAMLAHHAEQIERQAARQGRAVGFWDTIPGIPRATVEARRSELRELELQDPEPGRSFTHTEYLLNLARPHGLVPTWRAWVTAEDAVFGVRRAA